MASAAAMALPVADPASSSDPSWEGDRMFNIYIYDYCNKRGFRKTARELLVEADIPAESSPPINAKQGLLFEWWSVFWVLFTAKSNSAGTEDAMVYTQHQIQQSNLRQGGARPLNHQLPQASRIINGNPSQMPFAIPQSNGIHTGSTPSGPNPPSQNFTPLIPAQRPGGPQHRGPNGINPYQSPTIAHSPQNPGANASPNTQNLMNPLGPSPHLAHMARGSMLPPNVNLSSVPSTQTPPFSQLGRPSSRPGSPGQIMHPSPSLMDRQTPVSASESGLHAEFIRLPPSIIANIRQELGIHDKETQSLTPEEKSRIVIIARQRAANSGVRKPGPGGPQGPPGPSNLVPGMQLSGQRPGQPQPPQLPPQQQVPQQQPLQPQPSQSRMVKRSSTSPGDEHGQLSNSEGSPPDRKRPRHASVSIDQPPPVGYPHQPQQQVPQQLINGGMMRQGPMPGGPMNNYASHGPPAMGNSAMGIPIGPQIPGNTMSPGMGGPRPPNMMGQLQYHKGLHAVTKGLAMANLPGGGAGTPTPGEPSFNPGQPPFPGPQNNRLGQNKVMGMMPPPSPAGGPCKEQPKDVKPSVQNGIEGSPRNQQPPNPASGQGPPNANGGAQVNTAPPTPSATNSSATIPSPSSVVNGTPTINAATQPTNPIPEVPPNFLTPEFMQSVASQLDDFDPQTLFRTEDAGINFEHDFREWFNPDIEMK